jgi:hypothetical protein
MRRALILGLAWVAACANDPPDDDDIIDCALVTDDDDFVIGLEKQGASGLITVTLMSGDPAPPIRGDNTWVVSITSNATPMAGAFVDVVPFMPAHGHGSGKTVEVTEMPEDGQYELSPVNLWMPGVWETKIVVTPEGELDPLDQVVLRFCIPS